MRTPAELIAAPLDRFVALVPASPRPAPADAALRVHAADAGDRGSRPALQLLDVGRPGPVAAAVDWNHDFRLDLVRAGGAGPAFVAGQERSLQRRDVSGRSAAATVPGTVTGLWPADLDMDGDIDLVVGTDGPTRVLRNNGDGTWQPLDVFAGITGARAFAWADLDRDADPDAAFVAGDGSLRVLVNRQATRVVAVDPPAGLAGVTTVTAADLDADGAIDLVVGDAQAGCRA